MKLIINILFGTLLTLISGSVMADIQLGATRVIYYADQKEAQFAIINKGENDTYLVQSWIESDSAVKPPFIATPPLFRLDGKKERSLRIIKVRDDLPKDRESQFWLGVKPIPSTDNEAEKNSIQLVVKSRVKLFYRPKNLEGLPEDAYKKLNFSIEGTELKVTNPTPYYVTFYKLQFNGEELKDARMVAPKSSMKFHVTEAGSGKKLISWQAITDGGETTQIQNVSY